MNDEDALGMLMLFSGSFLPAGYSACNGQVVDIESNVPLYTLIGTTYGGDGNSTFGLPNLAGVAGGDGGQAQWLICNSGPWPDYDVYGLLGQVRPFPFPVLANTTLGSTWLPCDGRTLSTSENNALFSLLGTTFGGDGTKNFALPKIAPIVPTKGPAIAWYMCVAGRYPEMTCNAANPVPGMFTYDYTLGSVNHVAMAPDVVKTLCAFALCNGQSMSINDWTAIYALVGEIYGPATNTAFTLPNIPTTASGVTSLLCINGVYPVRS
ncbi:MAG: phage tail protein [Burkholderiales bacterium]